MTDKMNLPLILHPNLKDFTCLRQYMVEDKTARDALHQRGALKIIAPANWNYKFNQNAFDSVFNGSNHQLSFTNLELVDKLSFKRFFDLYLKSQSQQLDGSLAADLHLCATKLGVDLYKLYSAHCGSMLKWTDKCEQLKHTCSTLGIVGDNQIKVGDIIEKYLEKFQKFLCSNKKDLNLNTPSRLARHLALVAAIHSSSHPGHPVSSSTASKPKHLPALSHRWTRVDSLPMTHRWTRVEKLKLMALQYRKRAIPVKQRGRSASSVDAYFKKVTGVRKARRGRVQKAKHAAPDTAGVRSTRSMLRRSSAPEPQPTHAVTEDDKSDSPELAADSPSCRACGLSDLPRSQLRHCSACDLYFHATCSEGLPFATDSKNLNSSQWECPICFTTNWQRGAVPSVSIAAGESAGSVYRTLIQHESATKQHFRLAQVNGDANFLEHFWQVVLHGGGRHSDISVFHASTNEISGFAEGTPGSDQFSSSVLQGDAEDSSMPELHLNRLCMDSIYSTRGFSQEVYAAPSIHIIHRGAKKTWYVVRDSAQFGTLLKTVAPVLFSPPRHSVDLLASMILCVHPEDLLTQRVECEVFEQSEGEIVLFPAGVIKCYVSHGASISEEAVLPLPQWVPVLGRYFRRTRNRRNLVSYGQLLSSVTHSTLFTLPLSDARRLFSIYRKFVEAELSARQASASSGALVETGTAKLFQQGRCSHCAQKFFHTALEFDSKLFCLRHQPRLTDERKLEVKMYVSKSSREIERELRSCARRFRMYDQFAQSVSLLQDIHKKPDASDLRELLETGKKYNFTNNIYYEHLVTSEKCMQEFEQKFTKADVSTLSLAELCELRSLASCSDFLLPGEADLVSLLDSDREPRLLLSLYARGALSLTGLRTTVKALESDGRSPNVVNRASLEALHECIQIGTLLEEITRSIQHLHSCDEERVEQLIEQSASLPASEELETCITILKDTLEARQDWKNRALDLLDTDEPKVPLSEWVQVMDEGLDIHDYDDLKAKLSDQIARAREFEKVAKGIVLYEQQPEQTPLTHDVEEIATLLENADKNILVRLDTYELLSKEHKDAGIWLRLADLCFLWPQSQLEIISILMPKTFSPSQSAWFLPLVPGSRRGPPDTPVEPPRPSINSVLGNLLAQDKREVMRQEYQALLDLRAYHEGKQKDGSKKESDGSGESGVKSSSNVCFCLRNIYCSLIFCYLCRSYYHEKCITKALKRREVHNTESNISNLNYKVPPNLSALGDLDLFICVKCVWGKRPRLPDVKGRIVDVLSEVRLKLPEAIALVHCLQRTLYVQQEIKMYLTSREVVQLKELSEVQRESDRLLQDSFVRTGPSPTPSHASSRSSDDFYSNAGSHGNASSGFHSNGSSRTAGDTLISKQRKHKRKATLIPRIDNDSIAAINREEIKVAGIELLNKGLLSEIHIPELTALLTFVRHLDKEFGYYPKIKMTPPPKKPPVKKAPPPPTPTAQSLPVHHAFSSPIGLDNVAPPPGPAHKKQTKIKNSGSKVSFAKGPPPNHSSSASHPAAHYPSALANYPPPSTSYPSGANYPPTGPSHPASGLGYSATRFASPNANYSPGPSQTPFSSPNFPPNASSYPSPPACYPSGLGVVAEAAMLAAKIPPLPASVPGNAPSQTAGPKPPKVAKTKTPGAAQRASKSPGGPKTTKTPSPGVKAAPSSGKVPSSVGKLPSSVGKVPLTVGKSPLSVGKSQSAVGKAPSTVGKSPLSVGKTPSTVGKSPLSVGKTPSAVGKAPSSVGKTPSMVVKAPLTVEKPPPAVVKGPSSAGGPKLSPAGPKAGAPKGTATPGNKVRQRKPRTTPSNSPAGESKGNVSIGARDSTKLAPSSSSTVPPQPPKKKKKKEKFEFCDLEDCLEPEGEIDWVQCDKCERWFHFICVGITTISKDDPYVCTYCCNSVMCKMDSTEANEDTAVTSLLSLSRGFI